MFVFILIRTFPIVLTESRTRISTRSLSQASVSLQHVHSNSKLWFGLNNILSTPSFFPFSNCRGGGVLDKQPGRVPQHQHHVHPLSESSHSSRSGSQHQVRWCVTCTATHWDCSNKLQLLLLCLWLHLFQAGQWQCIADCRWKHFQIRVHQTPEEIQQL